MRALSSTLFLLRVEIKTVGFPRTLQPQQSIQFPVPELPHRVHALSAYHSTMIAGILAGVTPTVLPRRRSPRVSAVRRRRLQGGDHRLQRSARRAPVRDHDLADLRRTHRRSGNLKHLFHLWKQLVILQP
ncbi:hypothetical protein Scep_025327 [Stephania cephalantha]|uniref:Uncharacterized protein n=1 Tax=Stephania cephalantha TaxID=152367 RepID=A0AAP0ENM7_9MAGN